tara:strand:- start:95 stop:268 length:174 start_codon:yes stop_codon:yes gene_type:complete
MMDENIVHLSDIKKNNFSLNARDYIKKRKKNRTEKKTAMELQAEELRRLFPFVWYEE